MQTGVVTLVQGHPEYGRLLDRIRADHELVDAMGSDADSHPDELDAPGTQWSIALVDREGEEIPAAWCAAVVQDNGVLRCHSNYEVRAYRGHGLYVAAYRERHRTVIAPSRRPAVTYLYIAPIELHLADGWFLTGESGTSPETGHDWWELRR
jgi:hypothetical protein